MKQDKELYRLLSRIKDGTLSVDDAYQKLQKSEDLGFAKLDIERERRTGFPEIIFGENKTTEQVLDIFTRLSGRTPVVLATRVSEETAKRAEQVLPETEYDPIGRTLLWRKGNPSFRTGYIAVVTAGTSDMPVAEEAAVTVEALGSQVERIYDVGVAGLHRLLAHTTYIQQANAVIVVAGMEGALASVVGGLVAVPVIAVPTSVGYGANFQGLSALLTMLNSCAAGISVVNIDNGFGAGYNAALIHKLQVERNESFR